MRDQDQSRPLFTCDAKQQVGDRFSCLSVQIAGRFICKYEIWLAGERARHSHALAFAARQRRAALSNLGLIELRKLRNEFLSLCCFCRGFEFCVGRAVFSERAIVPDGAGEKLDVLKHHGYIGV